MWPPGGSRRRRNAVTAWLFALPFVLIFGVFMLGPLVSTFVMSFTDFTSRDIENPLSVGFVGLDQYAALFRNPQFLHSVLNTAYFVLAGIPLGIVSLVAADLIGTSISLIILLGAAAVTILLRPAGLLGVKE